MRTFEVYKHPRNGVEVCPTGFSPIAFFFTGTHPDYHANSDSVEKILFDKQARIAQLVYQIGFAIADTDRSLRRDDKGPRAGRGFSGPLQ